jgi:hypothetical protein
MVARRKIKAARIFLRTSMCTVAAARALADRLDRAGETRLSLDRSDLRLAAEVIWSLLANQQPATEIKLAKDVERMNATDSKPLCR